jgi:hypothetical protein
VAGEVVRATPGRDAAAARKRFAFIVEAAGRPVATWEYEITPRDGECEVTERTFDQRSLFYKVTSVVTTGLGGRADRNRKTMKETLDALARTVECRNKENDQ